MEWLWRFWKHLPRAFRIPLAGAFAALVPANPQNLKISSLMRDEGQIEHPYFLSRMLFMPDQRTSFLRNVDPEFAEIAAASQRDELESSLSLDPVNRISYLESRCYMLNTLLRDADCMSMSQGVEVRVPLIDHRLAKAVLGLPGAWKLDGTPKKLLVQALTASLPDDIVHRPKRGFTLPFEHWLRDELRPEMESVLSAKKVAEGPLGSLFNSDQVENVWRDFLRGKTSWSRPWSFYVLHRWCELNSISA
jgi:asparagine synthase (glutamine-hydrolysing)